MRCRSTASRPPPGECRGHPPLVPPTTSGKPERPSRQPHFPFCQAFAELCELPVASRSPALARKLRQLEPLLTRPTPSRWRPGREDDHRSRCEWLRSRGRPSAWPNATRRSSLPHASGGFGCDPRQPPGLTWSSDQLMQRQTPARRKSAGSSVRLLCCSTSRGNRTARRSAWQNDDQRSAESDDQQQVLPAEQPHRASPAVTPAARVSAAEML
jgi:hypothetical protein